MSLLSALVVGTIGYQSGSDALRASAFARLNNVRETRANEVQSFFQALKDQLVIYTRGTTAIDAVRAFGDGYRQLGNAKVTPAEQGSLRKYYDQVFLRGLVANTGIAQTAAGYLPTSPAQQYLQVHYTAPFTSFDDAIKVDDAKDGSAWSAAHARYHDYFRELTQRFRYDDAMLIDLHGNVVYSAYSGVDLGTNLLTGPYRGSRLSSAFTETLNSNSVDYSAVTDFDRYQPSSGVPTAFALSPIGDKGKIEGVLALEVPIASVNDLMTGNQQWKAQGLGASGETYLAGPDLTMRSVSRPVLEDPKGYLAHAIGSGTPKDVAEKAVRVKGSIELQPTNTVAVTRALQGQTGEVVGKDYLGQDALMSYRPLNIPGLRWVLVAQLSSTEAFAPVQSFARRLALSTGALLLGVALLSLLLAQVFVRPIRRLLHGVNRVAAGDYGVESTPVPWTSWGTWRRRSTP